VYPNIPQEFGGMHPRHAVLYVEVEKLHYSGLADLFPLAVKPPKGKLLRTVWVDILFPGDRALIVRPAESEGSKLPVYEIKRDIIQAIEWHD
jgi:hypothetical protein